MFGCIKSLIKIAIVVLALVGFQTLGGFEWVHDMWVKYHTPVDNQAELEKAKKIADISKAGSDYKFVKNTSMLGYNIVISQHNDSGQKLAILENSSQDKDFITQEDIENGNINNKVDDVTKKLKKQYINVKNFKLLKNNNKDYTTLGKIKYVQFEAGIDSLPFDKIKGAIGVYKSKDSKNKILVAANVANEYSQAVTDEYFNKIFN